MHHLAEGINTDVQLANTGIHSVWRKANNHVLRQRTTDMAILQHATEKEKEENCTQRQ